MYTFFKTEGHYVGERRKLPAFCRVKRPPRNKKAAAGKFSRGGLYCDIEFLSVPSLTIA